ncbi:MAG TPA: DUF1573 domain-containing protein [Pirellulales bacterium]|nr:DUF1573 domain-containing protein [Pirellulales bacterium]
MRIWLLACASLLVGVLGGAVSALWDSDLFLRSDAPIELTNTDDPELPGLPPINGPQPKVVVDAAHYHFGRMERKATGRHTFVLTNKGDYPLVLRKGKTTCKCTLSDMVDTELAPGASQEVTLEWNAKTPQTLFRQEATIFTNDPRRRTLTLTIEGLIVDSLIVNPMEIVFTNLTADEESTAKTKVFTSLSDDLQITGFTCENQETADHFDVHSEPLPKEGLPPEMTAGVEVRVTIKPGLAPGPIEQKIALKTNLADVPDPEVKIGGRIGSPIMIVGREWDQEKGTIRLGTVDGAKGTRRQLKLMVRGAHRQQIEMQAPQVKPDLLVVTLGEKEELGNVVAVPLTIEIPPGSPAANYLGYTPESTGEIVIPTNHPELGEVRLKVIFAVSDK